MVVPRLETTLSCSSLHAMYKDMDRGKMNNASVSIMIFLLVGVIRFLVPCRVKLALTVYNFLKVGNRRPEIIINLADRFPV